MAVKEKRDSPISPALIKFGVALAFALGGIVYSFLRTRIRPSKPKPSLPSSGKDSGSDSKGESFELSKGACVLQDLKVSSQNSIINLSSSSGNRDDFLLTEVDHLINEHNMAVTTHNVKSPRHYSCAENQECGGEIKSLRNKVKILEERERNLEIQLLEYYGIKEQETAMMELQNRLRVHNTEAKLLNLKIESLQSDKRKLEAQVADYAQVVTELEAAKAKIKLLRKKLRSEAEHNREQILSLQERVLKLQDEEKNKNGVEIDQNLEMQLQKMKELEEELDEMKKTNESLKLENSELAQKLEFVQMLDSSALDDKEMQALKEESQLLRHQNEDLRNEIEQLQADRCADIEELVYLRWINACLRYEMRNYQPGPGETIARDLSKSLSPRSEKKAKQLILEYANKEGSGDQGINFIDFDCDEWSTSQASYFTDSCKPDDLRLDNMSASKTNHSSKTKVLSKLMKLLRGKHDDIDIISRHSSNSHSGIPLGIDFGADGVIKTIRTSSGGSSANSVDLQRPCSRGQKSTTVESSNYSQIASDDSSLSIFRTLSSVPGYDDNSLSGILPHRDAQNAAKMELAKYAGALKNSHAKPSVRRRSASYSSF